MRANLPAREPKILQNWETKQIYKKLIEKNRGKKSFILHDGPPYANGDIHIGHALNKILKDIVVRDKNMNGFYSPYVPGWDTHGLPIEKQAIKKLGLNPAEAGAEKFRGACREFALSYVENQKEQFKRLGVLGDWDNSYLTLKNEFVARQVEIFGQMAQKGLIYKGLKPVYWCPDCETALAEAEIEYGQDKTSSIYVKFAVKDAKGKFDNIDNLFFVIWTTTTWTLPANMAICLNKNFEYSLVKVPSGETYVLATDLVESVAKAAGLEGYEIVGKVMGSELEGVTCQHPFLDRDSVVILGDHVTLEAGTGCVHTAPGHGMDDYLVCLNYDIDIVVPVDGKGHLNEHAGMFEGLYYEKANKVILEHLQSIGSLLAVEDIIHQYPHCWRCSHPILFRATEQWFCSVESFKQLAIKCIKDVQWVPAWGEERIINMVRDRNDWCISRQRTWGVPIPIFYCKECGKELVNEQTIASVAEKFREFGGDAWWTMSAEELLPENTVCSCGCGEFTKETDIMDVWFDSGSSHSAVCEIHPDLKGFPIDLYLEGNDQYRGWFQSSLLTSVATKGVSPYKTVVTHGFVIDKDLNKMSKSKGNSVSPLEIIEKYGADILRLWVVSSDYKNDIKISDDMLKQLSEGYRKIRNTARFILGNISDFNPRTDMVEYEDMLELDKWALMKNNQLIEKTRAAYDSFDYHILYHAVHNFCVLDMSTFYLDIIKDRLYTEDATGLMRRSAQSAMYMILDTLVRLLAPVLAYTSEEIWSFMPHTDAHDMESVLFNPMIKAEARYNDSVLEAKWNRIIAIRDDVLKALEKARAEKIIGQSLAAEIKIFAKEDEYNFLKSIEGSLNTIFITSGVVLSNETLSEDAVEGEIVSVSVSVAKGEKCERCWIYSDSVGKNDKHPTLCARCAAVIDK